MAVLGILGMVPKQRWQMDVHIQPTILMNIGDKVEKVSGYKFTGVIVAKYLTHHTKEWRYVVECTIPGCEGVQHIYSEKNIRMVEAPQQSITTELVECLKP